MTAAETEVSSPTITNALLNALEMAFSGDERSHGWYNGLLVALEGVSAAQASQPERTSIASHTEHVRFVLHVANAWMRGENPEVDWAESWRVSRVNDAEWAALLEGVKSELEVLRHALQERATWSERGLAMVMNNLGHTAHHAGAIRQLLKVLEAN